MKLILSTLLLSLAVSCAFAADGVKVSYYPTNDCSGNPVFTRSNVLGQCSADEGKYEGFALPSGTTSCAAEVQLRELKGDTQAACDATNSAPSFVFTVGKCFNLQNVPGVPAGVLGLKPECASVDPPNTNPTCAAVLSSSDSGTFTSQVFEKSTTCSGDPKESSLYKPGSCSRDKSTSTSSSIVRCEGSDTVVIHNFASCDRSGASSSIYMTYDKTSFCATSAAFPGGSIKGSVTTNPCSSASSVTMSVLAIFAAFLGLALVL